MAGTATVYFPQEVMPPGHHQNARTEAMTFGLPARQGHFQPIAPGRVVAIQAGRGRHGIIGDRLLIDHQNVEVAVIFDIEGDRAAPDAVVVQAHRTGFFGKSALVIFKIKIGHGYTVRIEVSISDVQIQVAVVVEIGKIGPPTDGYVVHTQFFGLLYKGLTGPLADHEAIETDVGDKIIQLSILVVVTHRRAHGVYFQVHFGFLAHVPEGVPGILILKHITRHRFVAKIMVDQQVLVAIVVVIGEKGAETEAPVLEVILGVHVFKRFTFFIAQQVALGRLIGPGDGRVAEV